MPSEYHHPRPSTSPNTSPLTLALEAALDYAAVGWPVFPCRPGGKKPLTEHGHLDATTDPEKIRAWWRRWPDANIGIPTGERSGILALDVDHPAGLDALEAEHGKLPATRTHSTGSGGMHYLLAYPADANIRNSASRLAPGLDVRGEGGYIVAPGSRTTRPYEVLDALPLADAPAWLLEALTRPTRTARETATGRARTITTAGGPIPDGTRDNTLARIAGRLHDGTRTLDELTAELLEVNTRRCQPPLPDGQVEKIARSIHARTPCGKSSQATPEVLEALEEIEAVLWRIGWRGMGELSARDLYVALIIYARRHGTLIPSGVRVSISVRALALAGAVSKPTAIKAISRLMAARLIRRDYGGRTGTEAGALVLLLPGEASRANLYHSSTGGGQEGSGKDLRAPRLRWSAPAIRRLGKTCGAVLDALDRRGGTATLDELADDLHKTRTRDLRRRVVARLEAAGVVECSGETVALARDWLAALNIERAATGEIAAHRRDMARYAREREAYANRDEIRPVPVPDQRPEKPPAGGIRELERVPDPAPDLLEALAAYLEMNPRRADEGPSWLAVALWAGDHVQGKPTPGAVEVALAALRDDRAA